MEGELTVETEYELAINEGERDEKAMAYHTVVSSTQSFIDNQLNQEIKRLTDIKKRKLNLIAKLEDNLLTAVELYGDFEVGLTKFSKRRSERVEVNEVNLLPKEFKTIKVTEQPNKAEIKKALKNGEEIKGAFIVENFNLKIN